MTDLTIDQKKALALADANIALQVPEIPPEPPAGLTGAFRVSDGPPKPTLGGFLSAVGDVGEGALDIAGKGLGGIAGGVSAFPFLVSGALGLSGGLSDPRAAEILSDVSGAVSAPFAAEGTGADVSRALSFPFEAAEKGADFLGDITPGGPGAQTAVKTTLLGLPAFLGPAKTAARTATTPGKFGVVERAPLTIKQSVLKEAQAEGYAIPSSDAVPGIGRSAVEGITGKPKLQEQAAFNNQQLTNKIAARELGLAEGVEITLAELDAVRATAGEAYSVLENAGTITPTVVFRRDLAAAISDLKNAAKDFEILAKPESPVATVIEMANGLNKQTFQASSVIAATKILRDEAGAAFRNGQPKVGQAYRDLSKALEDAAELHLSNFGDPVAVQAFRDARVQIAKTFSVEQALKGDGTVSAPALAAQRSKRVPLTGGLDLIARFAEQYPKSARVVKTPPPPFGRLVGIGGGATAGLTFGQSPALAAAIAAMTFGGPIVRAGVLSKPGQALLANPRGAITNAGQTASGLLESLILADQARASE